MQKNIALSMEIQRLDRYIYVTAKNTGIHYNQLSGIISGRIVAPEPLIQRLEAYFRLSRKKLGFK